jgi:hypothetical protein
MVLVVSFSVLSISCHIVGHYYWLAWWEGGLADVGKVRVWLG